MSAMSSIGKILFDEQVATVGYGINGQFRIVVVYKEVFNHGKSIFFVFVTKRNLDLTKARSIATQIFIQAKNELLETDTDLKAIKTKVDKILMTVSLV